MTTIDELLEIQNELDGKVLLADDLEGTIAKLESEIANQEEELNGIAAAITKKRLASAPVLTDKIADILSQLGMPNARFQFEISPTELYAPNGKDSIQLLFSANKGTDFGIAEKSSFRRRNVPNYVSGKVHHGKLHQITHYHF